MQKDQNTRYWIFMFWIKCIRTEDNLTSWVSWNCNQEGPADTFCQSMLIGQDTFYSGYYLRNDIRKWLQDRQISYSLKWKESNTRMAKYDFHVGIKNINDALLFKLTWYG